MIEIVGDMGYKKFADEGGIKNFLVGATGYIGVVYFLIRTLQGNQLLLINAAWDGLSALLESIAAMAFLGERFEDPMKYFGIALIIIGLFFLNIPFVSENKFKFPKLF